MSEWVNGTGGVWLFAIRHHSPACAANLKAALDELKPAQVLIEGPSDFTHLLPLLVDPRTLPPVAIVSLPEKADGAETIATYPFCEHSPEYVALRWADGAGAAAQFIDLPARHPDMRRRHARDDDHSGPLIQDWRLDHNAYVAELCARRGVPNGGALWDALFEAQGAGGWRGFFAATRLYCGHIRAVTKAEDIAADGDLAREAAMSAALIAAKTSEARGADGPIVVVTGGFHTPALEAALLSPPKVVAPPRASPQRAYLIRYGFKQLDRAAGYASGLPHPAWYQRLWLSLEGGRDPAEITGDLLSAFGDHLRRTAPQLALSTPTLTAAGLAAARLATLRDLPWPGRLELIDAVRSTAVKDAVEIGRTPLLEALDGFLTGDVIGDVPPGAAQPPIVASVRARAAALGFNLDTGEPRPRELDILRRPRHAQASRFLHALDLLDAGFARRISGPDPLTNWKAGLLIETWTYAWSPMVEQRLVGLAGDGETLEALCAAELRRRRKALEDQGASRASGVVAQLLVAAARTGFVALIDQALDWCAEAIGEDAEAASVIRALSLAAALASAADSGRSEAYRALRRRGFERLLLLFPHLAGTPPERLGELVAALAELAALVGGDEAEEDAAQREALCQAVEDVLAQSIPPALFGALAAFSGLVGGADPERVAARIATAMDGTYLRPGERAAALGGALAVSPRLLVRSEALLDAADAFLTGAQTDDFLALLPDLRLAFSQLTPGEVDAVADWAARRHGLAPAQLLDHGLDDAETAANLALSVALEARWRADGLSAWLGTPS